MISPLFAAASEYAHACEAVARAPFNSPVKRAAYERRDLALAKLQATVSAAEALLGTIEPHRLAPGHLVHYAMVVPK